MFDVGDLPVLTFGNWVLKAEWLSGLWNYMYVFFTFLRFFLNPKTWLFTFFLSCCTRFPQQWSLPLPTNPFWWGSMHAMSSYRGNRPTNTQTHAARPPVANTQSQTGPITIHCAAKLISAQCKYHIQLATTSCEHKISYVAYMLDAELHFLQFSIFKIKEGMIWLWLWDFRV